MSATICARVSCCGWVASLCFMLLPLAADDLPLQSTPTASPSTTAIDAQPNDYPRRPAHLIALRISAGMLAARINRDIDGQRAVNGVILGTPVTGVGRLTGKLRMHPVPSAEKACFNAVFEGTIYCRTVGHKQGVTVHSHSVTPFTASKEIVFEPSKGFYALPTKIAANTQCFTDGISSGRGGLIGRIIQRRASEQVAADRPQVAAIIRQRAMDRINARFDEFMNEELAELNKAVEFQTRFAQLRTGVGSRKLVARTTPEFIEIADAVYHGDGTAAPLSLPATTGSRLPIEIWIHGSLLPDEFIDALANIFVNPDESTVVKALAAWPGPLAQEAAAAIHSLRTENKFAVQEIGEWMVVEFDAPSMNHAVASTSAPPTIRR
jgi:hypothetical protein